MNTGKIPGWRTATCAVCQRADVRVGRPSVGFLGATPADAPQRFLMDVPEQCEECLRKLGLNRRNYGVPGLEGDDGMVNAIEASLPALKRKRDERWNYMADRGDIDPTNGEPMQKRPIE